MRRSLMRSRPSRTGHVSTQETGAGELLTASDTVDFCISAFSGPACSRPTNARKASQARLTRSLVLAIRSGCTAMPLARSAAAISTTSNSSSPPSLMLPSRSIRVTILCCQYAVLPDLHRLELGYRVDCHLRNAAARALDCEEGGVIAVGVLSLLRPTPRASNLAGEYWPLPLVFG